MSINIQRETELQHAITKHRFFDQLTTRFSIYLLQRSFFKITSRGFAELQVAICLPLGPNFILKYNWEHQSLTWPSPNQVVSMNFSHYCAETLLFTMTKII